jgi:hypothetical protein
VYVPPQIVKFLDTAAQDGARRVGQLSLVEPADGGLSNVRIVPLGTPPGVAVPLEEALTPAAG